MTQQQYRSFSNDDGIGSYQINHYAYPCKIIHVYFFFEPPPNSHTRSLPVKEISKKFCFYTISQQTHDIISGSSSDMKSIPQPIRFSHNTTFKHKIRSTYQAYFPVHQAPHQKKQVVGVAQLFECCVNTWNHCRHGQLQKLYLFFCLKISVIL